VIDPVVILKATRKKGVPQGGVISPLISNVYLNEIDKMLEKAIEITRYKHYTAVPYARFADDLVVLVDSHARHSWIVPALKKRMREEFAKLRVEIIWEASKLGGLNIKKCLQPRELTAEKSRSRIPTGSRPIECLGKAADTEEETGKCTRWDRRGRGPGIRGQICRDNVGRIPVAAGAGSNLRRLHERGQKPKSRRATRDWRMSP
jgi:hypothetical protein